MTICVEMVLVLFDPGVKELAESLSCEHVGADGDLELLRLLRVLLVPVLVLHDVHQAVHLNTDDF
jgi:hypothetical protein